jgi:hypothetical protein
MRTNHYRQERNLYWEFHSAESQVYQLGSSQKTESVLSISKENLICLGYLSDKEAEKPNGSEITQTLPKS